MGFARGFGVCGPAPARKGLVNPSCTLPMVVTAQGAAAAAAASNNYTGGAASGVAVWARIAAGPVRTSLISSDCLVVSVLRKICFS